MSLLPRIYLKFLIFLYNRALDNYLQPRLPPQNVKNNNETRTKISSIYKHLSFVMTQDF